VIETTLGAGGKYSVAKRPYCRVEWWFSEVEFRAPGAKRGRAQFHLRKPPRSTALTTKPSDPHRYPHRHDSREPRSLASDLVVGLKAGGCAVVVVGAELRTSSLRSGRAQFSTNHHHSFTANKAAPRQHICRQPPASPRSRRDLRLLNTNA
jgi:hypothetical protein